MLSNLGVADSQSEVGFRTVVVHWPTIQSSEYQLLRVVAAVNTHPHPLTDHGGFVLKLDLNVVTACVGWHRGSCIHFTSPRPFRSRPASFPGHRITSRPTRALAALGN